MTNQRFLRLNNGINIPQIGLGVYQIIGDNATEKAVLEALKVGMRHIDTAHAYQNERGVGRAIKNSGLNRTDVWITSKLWVSDYGKEQTPKAIDKMLERLNTDYLDLLLLHQPIGKYIEAYQAMEDALKAGKVRSIGLSNFYGDRLDKLLANTTVAPAVMQVELHPYLQQQELKQKMAKYDTKFEAWYPLGHGDPTLLNEPIFVQLAAKYHKSVAQIILRWHLQHDVIVFPKSTNPDHIKQNFDIFDINLTDAEMAQIDKLDKHHGYFNMPIEEQEKQFGSWVPAD